MKLSIVIPCFNEEEGLSQFYHEVKTVLTEKYDYELVFVDDGSSDQTPEIIAEFCRENQCVRGILLSRNFGHQSALVAGISESTGDVILMMDADLQHPPQLIPQMMSKLAEGYDVVNTIRKETSDSGFFKRSTSKMFYRLINYLSEIPIQEGAADFRIMTRKSADAFLSFTEKGRFNRGLISWMGFRTAYIEFVAPSRFAGKSKYSLRKMLGFARNGITAFSPKPLRLASFMGVLAVFTGFVYGLYILIQYLSGNTVAGWASTMLIILFLGGIQMLSIGILGEYIARIYEEAKNRPLYFIRESLNARKEKD